MDSCRNIKKYLQYFIEGSLEENLKKRIETHLESCAICREEKNTQEKIWTLLERWPSVEPSVDFRAKFWEKFDGLERQKRPILLRPFIWRLAPLLVSVFFIIIASSIFIKSRMERVNLAKNIELYQNLEIIQDIDFLVDLEFLAEQNEYEG